MAQPTALTGRLLDPSPDNFDGNHTKSELFKQQFKMYRGLNARHEVMQAPYLQAMLALTFIKGALVDDWAADQVTELETRLNDPNCHTRTMHGVYH